jgi:hypothetical protein
LTTPSLSGLAQEGQTLSASTGSWSGSPTAYSYAWQRCDASGGSCTPIAGAASSTYPVQSGDVGSTLRAAVTASNTAGATTAVSTETSLVVAASSPSPPSSQTATVSGSLNQKNPTRTFSVIVGTGTTHATLSFSKCSTMTLSLSDGDNASGTSAVTLDSTLAAGTYVYTVSGGRCSFVLTITSPTP